MANPQPEHGYVKLANELWDEVIRRDFTKRQKDILFLIWRLSYGCQKRSAYIPKLVYFELAGIGKNHIKNELVYLEQMRVLKWGRDEKTFEVNKNHDEWQVSPVKGFDELKLTELIRLNLQESSQNGNKKVPETGTKKFPKQELSEMDDIEKFPKQELGSSQNGNYFDEKVPKTGTSTFNFPYGDKYFPAPKDIIKDSINQEEEAEEERIHETALDAYQFSFQKFHMTGHIAGYIQSLYNRGITERFVIEVILEMGARGIGPDVTYMEKLAEDWISKGCYTREEARKRREAKGIPRNAVAPPQNRQEQRNDEAARKIREAEERERERDSQAVHAYPERVQQFYL